MMPHLLRLQVRQPNHRTFRLWIPVLPVLIVLSPLLLLVTLAAILACLVFACELVVSELHGPALERTYDAVTGLPLWRGL